MTDARYFQILFLGTLLTLGVFSFGFDVSFLQIGIVLASVLATQGLAIYIFRLPGHSLLSALISGLGLLLLGRSNSLAVLGITGVLSIASKFTLKWNGKHFFNPTNFGIMAVLLATGEVWISPGQWGAGLLLASWIFVLGTIVVFRAQRWDISFLFLLFFIALLALRVGYLGQRPPVLLHQLANGSLLIFTFFMISDPRSTPDHPVARLLFALAVAVLAFVFRFYYFTAKSLLFALFITSPLTPFLDWLFAAKRFEWRPPSQLAAPA